MKKYELINNSAILADFLHSASAEYIAVDTEFMRDHTYFPQLCLLQLASSEGICCVDVMAMEDLSAFAHIWADATKIKIVHSCRQDVEVLQLALKAQPQSIFDSQIAAAFCGYGEQISYAALVQQLCDVTLEKTQTRTDWSQRPLSAAQLHYAADDVRYLCEIEQKLRDALTAKGMLEWFWQECQDVSENVNVAIEPAQAYLRLKGYHKLASNSAAIARSLANWREQIAQQEDLPREWVLPTAALMRIAELKPTSAAQIEQINEVRSGRHRQSVFKRAHEIVQQIQAVAEVAHNEAPYMPMTSQQKKQLKAATQIVQEVALKLDMSAALLANRKTLEAFVRGENALPIFEGWRKAVVGEPLQAQIKD